MAHRDDGISHCPAGDAYQTAIDGQMECLEKNTEYKLHGFTKSANVRLLGDRCFEKSPLCFSISIACHRMTAYDIIIFHFTINVYDRVNNNNIYACVASISNSRQYKSHIGYIIITLVKTQ